MMRQSAGTLLPTATSTMSPGTSSDALTIFIFPVIILAVEPYIFRGKFLWLNAFKKAQQREGALITTQERCITITPRIFISSIAAD